ncbi:hypothetical protein M1523_04205 [Patescibacteria group bacterium]|nr:hypothetical protein [Patescibacteria group bacterium]MCL5091891.1 hypothetical protein [Patescibacteria group bacterium]
MVAELIRGVFKMWPKGEGVVSIPSYIPSGPTYYEVTDLEKLRQSPIYIDNLALLQRLGVAPLSLDDIARQLGRDSCGSWILFNTLPTVGIGAHWIVESWPEAEPGPTLAFCHPPGIPLYDHVRPFSMAKELPAFSGVIFQPLTLTRDRGPLTHFQCGLLRETVGEGVFDQVEYGDRTIYWAAGARQYLRPSNNWRFISPTTP